MRDGDNNRADGRRETFHGAIVVDLSFCVNVFRTRMILFRFYKHKNCFLADRA